MDLQWNFGVGRKTLRFQWLLFAHTGTRGIVADMIICQGSRGRADVRSEENYDSNHRYEYDSRATRHGEAMGSEKIKGEDGLEGEKREEGKYLDSWSQNPIIWQGNDVPRGVKLTRTLV